MHNNIHAKVARDNHHPSWETQNLMKIFCGIRCWKKIENLCCVASANRGPTVGVLLKTNNQNAYGEFYPEQKKNAFNLLDRKYFNLDYCDIRLQLLAFRMFIFWCEHFEKAENINQIELLSWIRLKTEMKRLYDFC